MRLHYSSSSRIVVSVVAAVVVLCLAFFSTNCLTTALRIAVFPIEESGHLMPMASIAHAAAQQGHSLDVFMPGHACKSTEVAWPTTSTSNNQNGKATPTTTLIPIVGAQQMVADHPDNFTLYEQVTTMGALESLGWVDQMAHEVFKGMAPGLKQTMQQRYEGEGEGAVPPPDVIITDYSTFNMVFACARATTALRKTPIVVLWPLTLSLPTTTLSYIPALGSGATLADVHNSVFGRVSNYLLQRALMLGQRTSSKLRDMMNAVGAPDTFEIDGTNQVLVNHFVITPSVYGLDLGQPLCPNIRPVGFLKPPVMTEEDQRIPQEWREWLLNECSSSQQQHDHDGGDNKNKNTNKTTLYVNMGSIATLPAAWLRGMERVLRHIALKEGICVVWKMRPREQDRLAHPPATRSADIKNKFIATGAIVGKGGAASSAASPNNRPVRGSKLAIVGRVPFPPKLLLSEGGVGAFVSHCGDTSVYESLEALVPIVGVPLFADQPDMCARVVDSEFGDAIRKQGLALPGGDGDHHHQDDDDAAADGEIMAATKKKKNEREERRVVEDAPLYRAIKKVLANREQMSARMKYARAVAESMGGAAEAVRVLELAAMHGGETAKHFSCQYTKQPWYFRDNWDVSIFLAVLVMVVYGMFRYGGMLVFRLVKKLLQLVAGGFGGSSSKTKKD